jgi:hypothetical protein
MRLILRSPNGGKATRTTNLRAPKDPAPTFEQPAEVRNAPSLGTLPHLSPCLPPAEQDLVIALAGFSDRSHDMCPHAFHHSPINTCYRNSAMTLLMHIDPFVDWLHINFRRAVYQVPDTVMSHLGHVAEVYWNAGGQYGPGGHGQSLWAFWLYFINRCQNLPNPWGSQKGTAGKTRQNDPNDLLMHIFVTAQRQLSR